MDENTPHPTPTPEPEPEPVEPTAQHPTYPVPPQQPVQAPHRSRTRRTIATITSTVLVAGAAGVGVGYLAGHATGGGSSSSASSSTPQNAGFGGSGGSGTSGSSGDGTQTIPQNPDWRWSTGGGTGQTPSDPYGQGGGLGGYGGTGGSTSGGTKATASQLTGLVRIVSTMKYAGAEAAGTGMVLTSDGEVVTNHHVVEGATSVKATVMSTGKTYTAKVVGTDAKDDVAVIQLTGASGLKTVTTDDSAAKVGDKVTAVGDANGTSGYLSAAGGRVTALNRSITTQSEGTATGERLTGLMEISNDVVSGDSGGATYGSDGQVVGMTTAASSGGSEIDGYAVPIAKVMRIVDDLDSGVSGARYSYGSPAFLGIGLQSTSTTVAGVYAGTPASQAGIAAGDKITEVDGTTASTAARLRALIAKHSPGDAVSITWTDTSGASHTKSITLTTGPIA